MLVFPWGGCGNTLYSLFAHLLVCWMSPKQVWRNFVQARSSVCWIPHCSWWFLSAKCGSSVSAKFLIYGAHTVCFCTLVTILDPLRISFN
jgi:hypothetical protein